MTSIFAEIGEKVFSFSVVFAIMSTIYALALASSGVDPGVTTRFFTPMSWFHSLLTSFSSTLPSEQLPSSTWSIVVGAGVALVLFQFIVNMLLGFLALADIIAKIIPGELSFLITPLYFMFSFFQLTLYIYIVGKIREILPA